MRVGRAIAVLLGCDPRGYPPELLIYTGTHEIDITSLYTPDGETEIPMRAVVPRLRPLNDRAPWPLQRPERSSGRDFAEVDRRYRRHMPQALRPRPVADAEVSAALVSAAIASDDSSSRRSASLAPLE
jgi:hypothetical protein